MPKEGGGKKVIISQHGKLTHVQTNGWMENSNFHIFAAWLDQRQHLENAMQPLAADFCQEHAQNITSNRFKR